VGGPGDNSAIGAAWVFTRSNGVWSQQGSKLVGSGARAGQGQSVALSADGNTAIVGGPFDDSNGNINASIGAAWIFTRSGDIWTQQGDKLVGTGAVENPEQGVGSGQGSSVALSADGNTAIVGGPSDSSGPNGVIRLGAAWVYTRSNGVWTQQGGRLVANDAVQGAPNGVQQGQSVALSADGNTAIVGGARR
jgi:hypothetical protein